jgi:hypothetical protein
MVGIFNSAEGTSYFVLPKGLRSSLMMNSPFKFIGTNAYWLHTLNTDQDIANTLSSIKAAGINVVRVWAFNGKVSQRLSWRNYNLK